NRSFYNLSISMQLNSSAVSKKQPASSIMLPWVVEGSAMYEPLPCQIGRVFVSMIVSLQTVVVGLPGAATPVSAALAGCADFLSPYAGNLGVLPQPEARPLGDRVGDLVCKLLRVVLARDAA